MEADEKKRAEEKTKLLVFLKKIPLFSDLPPSSIRKVLSICTKVTIKEGEILCKQDECPNAMYILLFGKLAVKIGDSAPVATIDPVSTIGEMGVFTGEPRTATVLAMQGSGLLSLRKLDLDFLMRKDTDFGFKIMSKIIKILAKRINDDNIKISHIQKYIISQEEQIMAEEISMDNEFEK
ncbi:cyclic nucleotide-binding domain-containing protein [Candidatus Latescibacterota bacterium]